MRTSISRRLLPPSRARGFFRKEEGAVAVEFALVLPLFMILSLGSIASFDVYRTAESLESSTGIVADSISREVSIDNDYLLTLHGLHMAMLGSTVGSKAPISVVSVRREVDDKGTPDPSDDEVSNIVEWDFDSDRGTSRKGGANELYVGRPLIPLSNGETALVIETGVKDTALFDYFAQGESNYENFAVIAPRFTAGLVNTDAQ